jgi:hypothetical protein
VRRLEKALRGVVRDLNELGRSFALLGGFAVSAQVEPRTTWNVDLAVSVDGDADAESLAFALSPRGYALDTTVQHTGTGRLATARTTSPSGAVIDLLLASSGIEPGIVSAAEPIEILDGFSGAGEGIEPSSPSNTMPVQHHAGSDTSKLPWSRVKTR